MEFVCLIRFDPKKVFDQSPESNGALAEVGDYNDKLRAAGQLVSARALTLPQETVTVRVREGKMSATDGPFVETKEMVGGFHLIEARDMAEAVRIAAESPFAKLGAIEIRPVVDYSKPRPKL